MNPGVDLFLENEEKWQKELTLLRNIICECGMEEDFKWKHPCYTIDKKNVVLIHGFKEYCALLFVKGSLLKDEEKVLVQQTPNVQLARQIRFTNIEQIISLQSVIKAYIFEAIEVEKNKVAYKKRTVSDIPFPVELLEKFNENPELERAFKKLTPGRQSGYLLFFQSAKKTETRRSRIAQNEHRIFKGKGLNDCVCGLSKQYPNCDGSHKSAGSF